MFIRMLIIFLLLTGFAFSQSADSYSNKMYFDREQVRKFTDTDTLFQSTISNLQTSIKSGGLKCEEKHTLRNIIATETAVIAYGVIDYVGYNLCKDGNEENWRFIQGVLFTGINYLLNRYVSTKSAIGFSLQVWGGVPDAVYYGVDKFSGGFGGFSKGNEFNMSKNLSHLNFMPTVIGRKTIRGVDLITNVILTTAIAVVIQF